MRNCVHCAVEIPPGLAPAPKILQQDRMAGSGLPSGIATSGAFPQEEVLSRSGWGLLLSAWPGLSPEGRTAISVLLTAMATIWGVSHPMARSRNFPALRCLVWIAALPPPLP